MKIAILFTGNIRQFEYIKKIKLNYKNIIDKYNCDIFVYTDNNDFFYDDVQYFSDKNINKLVRNLDENFFENNNI
jgi:hypothetical protein